MSTAPPVESTEDAIGLLERAIYDADRERSPISRQGLASLVQSKIGMPLPDAIRFVDEYCDDKAPGVPYYLQEEFAIPYMKVVAVFLAVVSIALFWYSVVVYRSGKPNQVWLIGGTVIMGIACLTWFKSVEMWAARKGKTT